MNSSKTHKREKPGSIIKKSILVAFILAPIVILMTFFQLAFPFFINPRILKFVIYALTMFMPLFIDILLGLAGLKTGELGFYIISMLYHTSLFYILSYLYFKTKNKKRFLITLAISVIIYAASVVFYMW